MDHVLDEAGAIEAARRGDRDAFCALVSEYQEVAFRAAYLVVRDAAAAEDVAQEAFVRAYQGLRSFRQGEAFRPWLLRIVTNLALNEIRAQGRRRGLLERFARFRIQSEPEPPPERAVIAGADHALLWQALQELPGDDRVILYLRYFLDLPEREIAAAVGHPAGTVKSRLHRASGRLRQVIEQRYPSLRPAAFKEDEATHA